MKLIRQLLEAHSEREQEELDSSLDWESSSFDGYWRAITGKDFGKSMVEILPAFKDEKEQLKDKIIAFTLRVYKKLVNEVTSEGYSDYDGSKFKKWLNFLKHHGFDYPELHAIEKNLYALATNHLDHDELPE